jgi:type 2 lantibiotic biosynthesis protein LanM
MENAISDILQHFRLRGFDLRERIALQKLFGMGSPDPPSLQEERETLLRQWKRRLEQCGVWEERLAALGVQESDFFLAAAPLNLPHSHATLARIQVFLEELFSPTNDSNFPRRKRRYEEGLPPIPPALQRYVENQFYMQLTRAAPIAPAKCADLNDLIENEINYTLEDLQAYLLPVLITELHVAGARNWLEADTPQQRFMYFCDQCIPSTDWLVEVLATYPVAVRSIENIARTRITNFLELLRRFDTDYGPLEQAGFFPAGPGSILQHISSWSGDRHREGRSVRILQLVNGGKLVYKPRAVQVDVAFQGALQWLNSKGFAIGLKGMQILDREQYGWFEFVAPGECQDAAAVGRFYRRQGAHLALLYLLGGRDFLADNVRASGEYPVLVDLECLLSTRLPALAGLCFDSAARRYVEDSVSWTGLLPAWSWAHYGRDGVDLSALTAPGIQMSPREMPYWVDRGTDSMRQERRRIEIPSDKVSLPSREGIAQPVDAFVNELRAGFQEAYTILDQQKSDLLADGVLDKFATAQCRLVLHGTFDYATLLSTLRHPRYLRDALRCSEFLDRLWSGWCPRYTALVIEAESDQLRRGDIPLFTTFGGSRDLFDDRGRLIAQHYLEEAGMDGVQRRLTRMGLHDLRAQLDIIDGALGTAALSRPGAGEIPIRGASSVASEAIVQLSAKELVDEATSLGAELLAEAMEDEASLNWIGLMMNPDAQWSHGALDASLYDGFTGIGVFLLYLAHLTHDSRFEAAWEKIYRYSGVEAARYVLRHRSRLDGWFMSQPTGFTFPFSSLYLGVHAAQFGNTDGLDLVLDAALAYASVGLNRKPRFDFMTGAAGVIRALLVAYRSTGSTPALTLARSYGDQLVRHALRAGPGLGWPSDHEKLPPLMGGFSHGVSGIAWVLADLGHETGIERYVDASAKALAYDRTLFSASREDWVDLREPSRPANTVQWCHGPAGIGLSRALIARYLPNDVLTNDVARAVHMTLAGKSKSDCLCHGTLGNADCCSIAGEELRNPAWADAAKAYAGRAIQEAHARGYWRSGVPGHDTGRHGLFMGMAGIGYALLRLARPDIVPSVLYLESPKVPISTLSNKDSPRRRSLAGSRRSESPSDG